MTLSTLRRKFNPDENDQKLKCIVVHLTLAEPQITTLPITVLCKYHMQYNRRMDVCTITLSLYFFIIKKVGKYFHHIIIFQ